MFIPFPRFTYLVPTLRVGMQIGRFTSLIVLYPQAVREYWTQSVLKAFPRKAWERDAKTEEYEY